MDTLLILNRIVPSPKFGGSLTIGTETAYNSIRWNDERPKPTWQALEAENIIYEAEESKKKLSLAIYKKYSDKMALGVVYSGSFVTLEWQSIIDPIFQYDEISQNRLLKLKDITSVNFWRSLDNKNVGVTVAQKNELYMILLTEWGNDFKNRLTELEAL